MKIKSEPWNLEPFILLICILLINHILEFFCLKKENSKTSHLKFWTGISVEFETVTKPK